MITLENQFVLMFDIGEITDFISVGDLKKFLITEASGGEMPALTTVFDIRNADVRKKLTQKETIKISMGRDVEHKEVVEMMLYTTNIIPTGSSSWRVEMTAMLNVPKFWNEAKKRAVSGTGIEAIKSIAGDYFEVQSDCANSVGEQPWIQYGLPDRKFIAEIWKHSYIEDSFPLLAVSLDGSFILRDIKTIVGTEPRYDLTKDVVLNGLAVESSNFGFLNNWAGFGREQNLGVLETAEQQQLRELLTPMIAVSQELEQHSDPGINTLPYTIQNDNVNDNYQKALLRNTMGLATFSGVALNVSFSNQYLPIRPLDYVFYSEPNASQNLSVESVSGNYVVSRIGRSIESNKFMTNLELVRESRNTQ